MDEVEPKVKAFSNYSDEVSECSGDWRGLLQVALINAMSLSGLELLHCCPC